MFLSSFLSDKSSTYDFLDFYFNIHHRHGAMKYRLLFLQERFALWFLFGKFTFACDKFQQICWCKRLVCVYRIIEFITKSPIPIQGIMMSFLIEFLNHCLQIYTIPVLMGSASRWTQNIIFCFFLFCCNFHLFGTSHFSQ